MDLKTRIYQNQYSKAYYAKNKEYFQEYYKNYYWNNRIKIYNTTINWLKLNTKSKKLQSILKIENKPKTIYWY